jgi:hypothetical protein
MSMIEFPDMEKLELFGSSKYAVVRKLREGSADLDIWAFWAPRPINHSTPDIGKKGTAPLRGAFYLWRSCEQANDVHLV